MSNYSETSSNQFGNTFCTSICTALKQLKAMTENLYFKLMNRFLI
ncbi:MULTISPECIES: hypothetical protein [Bacillaceae]|nr:MULTISPECIES: hypothetical protein [Bacillaceae]SFC53230.1 hypothetical protein SAMN02799633_01119 [Bacillus sp. UNCCL81]